MFSRVIGKLMVVSGSFYEQSRWYLAIATELSKRTEILICVSCPKNLYIRDF